MQESVVFLVRVHCRRKESSRSLSHLLMSFLSVTAMTACLTETTVQILPRDTFRIEFFSRYEREVI